MHLCLGPLRVISIGAGVSGINLAKILPEELDNVSLTIYEKNPEVGGTWFENR
jgi:cation diffusion facilitator CzcD-associated flavoprotein CzcO